MRRTRKVTLHPDGFVTKNDFTVTGAPSAAAALADRSDSSFIASTTNNHTTRLTFGSFFLLNGEYVAKVRVRYRAWTQPNHTITFTPTVGGTAALGGMFHILAANQPLINRESQSFPGAGDPFGASGNRGKMTQAMIDGLGLDIILTESSAQAATSKVYMVALDVYVAYEQPHVISNNGRLEMSDGTRAKLWGVNYRATTFHAQSIDTIERELEKHQNKGFNAFRIHLGVNALKTATGSGATLWSQTQLGKLVDLMAWCNERRIYIHLTLMNTYKQADNPAWYEGLSEANRWNERRFHAVKITGMFDRHPAKAYVSLINEGVAGTSSTGWMGSGVSGDPNQLIFGEWIVQAPAGRTKGQIWSTWLADIFSVSDGLGLFDSANLVAGSGTFTHWADDTFLSPAISVSSGCDLINYHTYERTELDAIQTALDSGLPVTLDEYGYGFDADGNNNADLQILFDAHYHSVGGMYSHSDGLVSTDYPRGGQVAAHDLLYRGLLEFSERHAFQFQGVPLPVILDPFEDHALNLNDGAPGRSGYVLLAEDPAPSLAPPPVQSIYVDTVDTEGAIPLDSFAPKYGNRPEITFTVRVYGTDPRDLDDNLAELYGVLGKIQREGGQLGWTFPAPSLVYFDLYPESDADLIVSTSYPERLVVEVALKFAAAPFWRADLQAIGAWSETDKSVLVTDPIDDMPGDVHGELVAVLLEQEGANQWQVDFAPQSQYLDTAETARLHYEAAEMTPLGAAAAFGSTITTSDLGPTWLSFMESDLLVSGPLTHKASFKIKVKLFRPTSNTGAVSVRAECGVSDALRMEALPKVDYGINDREGGDTWADLGTFKIDPSFSSWRFRVAGKSTVQGDDLAIKEIALMPVSEGYIELECAQPDSSPVAFDAADTLIGASPGSLLDGQVAPTGGTWDVTGDATGFAADAASIMARSAVSDAVGVGAFANLPVNLDAVEVQVNFAVTKPAAPGLSQPVMGVLARTGPTVANDHIRVVSRASLQFVSQSVEVVKRVSGVDTLIVSGLLPQPLLHNAGYGLSFLVDTGGRWMVVLAPEAATYFTSYTGQDDDFATGGPLDSGGVGIYDEQTGTATSVRRYRWFRAWETATDAAVFANKSLTLTSSGAQREDESGGQSSPIAIPRGPYPKIAPAGPQGGRTRFAVMAYRNDPATSMNSDVDDKTLVVYATPRGRVVPMLTPT